jgi:hypothetical protein
MQKITLTALLSLILELFFLSNFRVSVQAAKKFMPKKATVKKIISSSIPAVVKYKPDKKGIYLYFSNFNGIDSVSYSFTYSTNGNPQGAGGNITADNNPLQQRELLFGTCSTSVCTYHNNITDARLTLNAKYKNGRKLSKLFRIKSYF